MDLGDYDESEVLAALLQVGSDADESERVLESVGESIAEILLSNRSTRVRRPSESGYALSRSSAHAAGGACAGWRSCRWVVLLGIRVLGESGGHVGVSQFARRDKLAAKRPRSFSAVAIRKVDDHPPVVTAVPRVGISPVLANVPSPTLVGNRDTSPSTFAPAWLSAGRCFVHQIGPEGFDILRNDLAGLMPRSLRSDHSIQTLLPP
jgi:hypothetical protein